MKRNLGKADEIFDIPAFDYFEYGNAYLGSKSLKFRYRINKEEDAIKAEVWNEDVCYELCSITSENSFEASAKGLDECILWLLGEYEKVE